jgi:hypothetical protein
VLEKGPLSTSDGETSLKCNDQISDVEVSNIGGGIRYFVADHGAGWERKLVAAIPVMINVTSTRVGHFKCAAY